MPAADDSGVALTDDELQRLRDLLATHGVDLAVVFGSAARPESDPADVDIAVEFAEYHPTDDGYAAVYLDLYTALADELDAGVDLVDVHSTSPAFARVVFDDGVLVLGSTDRLASLERRLAGDEPSVEDARRRVAAAAGRLGEESSS